VPKTKEAQSVQVVETLQSYAPSLHSAIAAARIAESNGKLRGWLALEVPEKDAWKQVGIGYLDLRVDQQDDGEAWLTPRKQDDGSSVLRSEEVRIGRVTFAKGLRLTCGVEGIFDRRFVLATWPLEEKWQGDEYVTIQWPGIVLGKP